MYIRPEIVEDIECCLMFDYKNKEGVYCIGSRDKDKYFFVNEKASKIYMDVIKQMDGNHTLEEIKRKEKQKSGISGELVDKIYDVCLRCNLIKNASSQTKEFNEVKAVYKDVFKVDISSFCEWCKKIDTKIYMIIIIFMLLIIGGASVKINQVVGNIPWNCVTGDFRVLIYTAVISTVSLALHELCHAVTGAKLGLPVQTAHIATFTYVTFACYIKLPGIYFLKPRKRVAIWMAGVFMNFFLIAVSIFMYDLPGEQGQIFLTTIIICNLSIIVSALVPFYISDGYFVLSTICKAPNLRKNIFQNIENLFKKRKIEFISWVYVLYFVCSILFIVVMVNIVVRPIVNNIHMALMEGDSFWEIVVQNINIAISIIALTISNIVKRILKKEKSVK